MWRLESGGDALVGSVFNVGNFGVRASIRAF